MANPFDIQPLGGLNLGNTLVNAVNFGQQQQDRTQQQEAMQAEQQALQAQQMQAEQLKTKSKELYDKAWSGDLNASAELYAINPELGASLDKVTGVRDEQQKAQIGGFISQFISIKDPEKKKEFLRKMSPQMEWTNVDEKLMDMEDSEVDGLANLIAGQYLNKEQLAMLSGGVSKGFAPSISTPQVDPETGQQYVIVTDANTQQTKRVDVAGGKALTGDQKMQLDVEKGLLNQASEISKDAFNQIANVKRSMGTIDEAISALDKGASTGVVSQYLPSFTESTIALENAANRMGLDIISATTFGALSEGELKLAMSTAVPLRLAPAELKTWLKDKKKSQLKLTSELNKMAIALGKGKLTPAEYLEKIGYQESAAPVEQQDTNAQSFTDGQTATNAQGQKIKWSTAANDWIPL